MKLMSPLFFLRFSLFGVCLLFLSSTLLSQEQSFLQEQYRSRVYVDLEQDATENVTLSVSELEQKLHTFQDDATRANAERFLAKQYAGNKDYKKASTYIEDALKRMSATDPARADMLMQLTQLYLLQKNNDGAAQALQRYLATRPPERADDYVLLAQIQYLQKQYVASAAALDKAFTLQKNPDTAFLQNAMGIYYSIGNFERCAQVIQQLVAQDVNNAELWQQWVSLYLKAGKTGPALDVMSLAWEKGIPFRDQDLLLLTDLYAINKIPARGARVLEQAIQSGRIKADGKINERLFRLWMLAGERDKATLALEKTALKGTDTELQLHLAQLYMEKEQWQAMQDIVLKACDGALPEKRVARANLLLGVSQLKLGDTALARRSFINATVVGGAGEAGQWLQFMHAEPPTKWEKIGIAGPCYSDDTRSLFSASMPESGEQAEQKTDPKSGQEAPATQSQ